MAVHLGARDAGTPGTWFSDPRSPSRRLHLSWHGEQRLIVISLWSAERCTGSFRLPVEDAARLAGALVEMMGRALLRPTRPVTLAAPTRGWRGLLIRLAHARAPAQADVIHLVGGTDADP
jgi:hypothetical protein